MQEQMRASADSSLWWLPARTARLVTPLFLLFGVGCFMVSQNGGYSHRIGLRLALVFGAVMLGFIGPVRDSFDRLWEMARRPSPRVRGWMALGIWIGSSLFLYWTQRYEKIQIHPKFQDEFSYLIQMRMLAEGRLWMPAIPCADFFDTFYVLVRPVYASMYFPGAAMMFAPALVLHLPYVVGPLTAAGLCAAMVYLVFGEILDGASGLLAVLILLSLAMFRMFSIMVMAQIPMLLLGLIMTWAVLRWRSERKWRWLFVLGAAAGWGAITRPADAVCFAIVLASVMVMDLWRERRRVWGKSAACVMMAALPFLMIQLVFDRNVTGSWVTTPFAYYTATNYPGAIGFHEGEAPLHVSNVPEKQMFYEMYAKGVIEQHRWGNVIGGLGGEWAAVSTAAMPDVLFWIVVPMSALALWDRKRWLVWGVLPAYLLVLAGYSFSAVLPHYVIVVMPVTILFCVLPIRFLTDAFPGRAGMIRTMCGLAMIGLAVAAMPQMDRVAHDQYFETPELEAINANLSRGVLAPAVVMFHFNRNAKWADDPSVEPVFNADVAWPDDAAVIRAHDLNGEVSAVGTAGDRDVRLYEYYSRIDPDRVFYLYDRGGGAGKLTRLGTGAEMLQRTGESHN